MLRTLHPREPELVRLCRSKTWDAVVARSETHPLEAMPTDSAARGESSTALSLAVRSGAPSRVIEFLLRANWNQIGVTHDVRGSILHEALKHQVSDDVLHSLIRAAIRYEQVSRHHHHESQPFLLLGHKDDLGRTALHYMVEQIVRALDRGDSSGSYWGNLLLLVQAYPCAVEAMDADGNTPLVLLLLTPRFHANPCGLQLEIEVFRMVQLLVAACPPAAAVSRRLPRPWHYQKEMNSSSLLHGDGVPSPLSCALLNGRCWDTIRILLDANRQMGCASCRRVVTHYREVPLHIAITMRSSIGLIRHLLQEEREVLLVADINGLIPLDWMWIRHVLDWFSSPAEGFAPVMVSRRRYLGNHFLEWQGRVTNQYLGVDMDLEESPNHQVRQWTRRLKDDLLRRMAAILPAMAAQCYRSSIQSCMTDNVIDDYGCQEESWPLLHAACFVSCPLAMVRLAILASSPEVVRSHDSILGRLPLHYAAARGGGHMANFPVGVSCSLQSVQEPSPTKLVLSAFPSACQVRDGFFQLPLHIAIDAAKQMRRRRRQQECNRTMSWDYSDQVESQDVRLYLDEDVELLLSHCPDTLDQRDGVTKLYPFQQAAEGTGASLNTIYTLLRRNPMLVNASGNSR